MTGAGVRLISSTSVKATNPKNIIEGDKIELTPWDLLFLPTAYIQRGFLFNVPQLKGLDQDAELVQVLINNFKTSLSKALDQFPPLSGRLATTAYDDDDTVSFFIDCNNAGALFVHAAVEDDVTTADISRFGDVPSIADSFFLMDGVKNYQGTSNPVIAVQFTTLVDGVFLAISTNHAVIDGIPFIKFFNYWMALTRDIDSSASCILSKQPVFQRWTVLNSCTDSPVPVPVRIPRSSFMQIADHNNKNKLNVVDPSSSPLKVRMYHVSKEALAKLKDKANADNVINDGNGEKLIMISSFQAFSSLFWRCVVRNKRNIDHDEETTYGMFINTRERLKQVPEEYFGNAVQVVTVTMKVKELLHNGVGYAAREMNRALNDSCSEEKMREFLEGWKKGPRVPNKSAFKNLIVTTDSPHFDVYRVDTALGRPVAIRSGFGNRTEGRIKVRRAVEEGIEIEVVLSLDTFQALENDQEFMDIITPLN